MHSPTATPHSPNEALCLQGELTVFRAAELAPLLDAEPPPAALDLSGVTEIDTAGLQLLLRARRRALDAGRTLPLLRPSEAVTEVCALLGLAAWCSGEQALPPGAEPSSAAAPAT